MSKNILPSEFKGRPLALYFYPKDNTSGCTREAQDFRDLYPDFQAIGVEVVGVSRDDATSHEGFRAKQSLPFPLIADVDGTLCLAFDVWKEKSMYGRKFLGIERSTFLIDADGHVVREWRKVKVTGHAAEVLAAASDMV